MPVYAGSSRWHLDAYSTRMILYAGIQRTGCQCSLLILYNWWWTWPLTSGARFLLTDSSCSVRHLVVFSLHHWLSPAVVFSSFTPGTWWCGLWFASKGLFWDPGLNTQSFFTWVTSQLFLCDCCGRCSTKITHQSLAVKGCLGGSIPCFTRWFWLPWILSGLMWFCGSPTLCEPKAPPIKFSISSYNYSFLFS